ncbi:Uncharacterised protein [Mycobacteroides abscessus subsp. abscessus]|nr:Uncharacterised protein [Mycobacteroides abscessus subsp. abscessus]
MPIASPRRCGGNQPTITRPLAPLVLAAPTPPTNNSAPKAKSCVVTAAAAPATNITRGPATSTLRSPMRSTT